MHYKGGLLKKEAIKNKCFHIKEFDDGSRIIMSGLDMNFRRYNLHNTKKLMKYLGISGGGIAKTRQKHTKNIVCRPHEGEFVGIDGFITDELAVMIVTADCIPLLIRAKDGSVAALLHAGWRGVQKRIYVEALRRLNKNPKSLEVYMLPSIGRDSFQVGEDFIEEFEGRFRFKSFLKPDEDKGKYLFDLKRFVKAELIDLGLNASDIYIDGHDTFTSDDFHSYRREGKEYGLNAIIFSRN